MSDPKDKSKITKNIIDHGDKKIFEQREVIAEVPEGFTPEYLALEIIVGNEHHFSGPSLGDNMKPLMDAIGKAIADAGYSYVQARLGIATKVVRTGKLSDTTGETFPSKPDYSIN